jgi:hypothetical protein
MSDSRSAVSDTSSTLAKIECPHCNKDLQIRQLFNHIRTKHISDFLESINEDKCKLSNSIDEPLEICWLKKNDFDEEEAMTLFACLGSNKTFTTASRATCHFKKDKESFKIHKKEMKKLFTDIAKRKELKAKSIANNPTLLRYKKALAEGAPELPRAYWRNILWYSSACEKVLELATKMFPQPHLKSMYLQYDNFNADKPLLNMWIDNFQQNKNKINLLLAEKCLDVGKLEPFVSFFEQFVSSLLRRLMEWHDEFRPLYFYDSNSCLRIPLTNYSTEYFLCANENMPGVDF